jgi:hypothetical protein
MGLLDRLRASGEKTYNVQVMDASRSFQGSKGDTIYSSGYVPVDAAGNAFAESDHRTSHPRVAHCQVAGTHHNPSALADSRLDVGARVSLRPEPGNPSDPNAVGVWDASGSVQAGYLPATLSRTIARSLRGSAKLEGQVIRELRLASPTGPRIALYVLIAPPGRLQMTPR